MVKISKLILTTKHKFKAIKPLDRLNQTINDNLFDIKSDHKVLQLLILPSNKSEPNWAALRENYVCA